MSRTWTSIFLILICIFACNGIAQAGNVSNIYFKVSKSIGKELPQYNFGVFGTKEVDGTSKKFTWNTIRIFQKGSGKVMQTLRLQGAGSYQTTGIVFEDMNFDGFLDFRVMMLTYRSDEAYTFFLWNPKLKKYVESEEFIGLTNPVFYSKTKTIHSSYRIDYTSVGYSDYKIKNGKLIEILRTEVYSSSPDGGYDCERLWKLKNGKMIQIKDECAK